MSEQIDIAVDLGVVAPPLPEILTADEVHEAGQGGPAGLATIEDIETHEAAGRVVKRLNTVEQFLV